ncbi:cytochrome P450 [Schizophyllum amplum]|uniref:Cytochrome P450 n=1 Tax=Schizophyllum amplum TaxID=97359 RepID=A0A550CW00_9AGAR|nr:cytochrome P450 [Auriculariopsis ampla]
MSSVWSLGLLGTFVTGVVLHSIFKKKDQLPYPPGPKGAPIIGNMNQLPHLEPFKTYTEWSKTYGELIHLTALGKHIVIVNSVRTANDLLEKMSKITSDRPENTMIKLMHWDVNVGLKPYGEDWRRGRRIFHQQFNLPAIPKLHPVILRKSRELLRNLQAEPTEVIKNFEFYVASAAIYVTYGIEIMPEHDRIMDATISAIRILDDAILPGSQILDLIPPLRYLPEWFPGATFHRTAAKSRQLVKEMRELPFNVVKERMAEGTAPNSWAKELIESAANEEEEKYAEGVTSMAFSAAADTTNSTLRSFLLEMVLNPEVQARAQAELDAVIGERLPTHEDRPHLPYIDAILKEVMRMHPAIPLVTPHDTTQDIIYEGQFIPKGTSLVANTWCMGYNPEMFPEPEQFKPERYLDPALVKQEPFTFGFGRRICVGRYLGEAVMWIAVASLLSTFTVVPMKRDGKEVPIAGEYCGIMIRYPAPFECMLIPRSQAHMELIKSAPEVAV